MFEKTMKQLEDANASQDKLIEVKEMAERVNKLNERLKNLQTVDPITRNIMLLEDIIKRLSDMMNPGAVKKITDRIFERLQKETNKGR